MEQQIAPPPPGGDQNIGPELEIIGGLFLSIATVLVCLRSYVRVRMVKKHWWDDFFLLLGLLFDIPGFVLVVARMNSGYGRHVYYLSPEQIIFGTKLAVWDAITVVICLMFTKISICLALLRIFMTHRAWRRAMYIIMALIVVTHLTCLILFVVRCNPIAKLWNPNIKGTCWPQVSQLAILYYQGGVSISTDFLLASLPLYFLKDLQISPRTKLSICALMCLGAFTGVCATVRTALFAELQSSDVTYDSKMFIMWTMLEKDIAIIAASMPALRPLWVKSIMQNQKAGELARRPYHHQHLKSTFVMMEHQTDSLLPRPGTCVTAQGRRNQRTVGSEATFMPDGNGIMKMNDFSMETFRKFDGKWIPEHSSGLSEREESSRPGVEAV